MMYKLINKQTGEEHICQKVVIDGMDYYVSDETPKKQCYVYDILDKRVWKVTNEHCLNAYFEQDCKNWRIILTTNNPSIDVTQVVDEVEELAKELVPDIVVKDVKFELSNSRKRFIEGYNKSQETHPFSEEDMISFYRWLNKSGWQDCNDIKEGLFVNSYGLQKQEKELLQLWKEQQPKTLYYE